MSLKKRLDKIESRTRVKDKPTAKCFIHHYDGSVTGEGVSFDSMEEFDAYAEKEGLNEGLPYFMMNIVNCKEENLPPES